MLLILCTAGVAPARAETPIARAGCGVATGLDATLAEAEARLLAQFAAITVEEVAQDFERRMEESGHTVSFPWHGATGE